MKASESVKRDRNRAPSAEGAEYESQGQARSASPLVTQQTTGPRPERPKYYYALSGLMSVCWLLPGATRFALAPGFHISRRWRSGTPNFIGE